jgi:glucose/arabinose dehydrogenase
MRELSTFTIATIFLLLLLVIFSSIVINYTYIDGYAKLLNNGNKNKTLFYGCQDYGTLIHCDRLLNELQSYLIRGIASKVYSPTAKPMFVDGKQGEALDMQANRLESIEFRSIKHFNSPNFSVSFWVKRLPVSEAIGNIVSHFNSTNNAGWNFQMLAHGNLSSQFAHFVVTDFVTNFMGNLTSPPDVQIPANTFVHLVGTFDGSTVKIYKDGVLAGKAVLHGVYIPDPKSPLRIGAAAGSLGKDTWSGIIDDLRLYNKTLSENEVKNIFINNSANTMTKGLVGHWSFNNNLNDTSVYRNNGILRTSIASMAFTPDGTLFFTEKNTGNVKIMKDDKVLDKPFVKISDIYVNWEQGLLSLAVDPHFKTNHFVYLYYTAIDNDKVVNRLVRFTDINDTAEDKMIILDNIPAVHGYHSGGALAFGPDDKLYIGVGDATYHIYAQTPFLLIGKVLRINRDGTIPKDNPYPNSPVYTIGHRNIFGIAFDNKHGIGIIAENGDYHYDEINLIQKGGNYGFPTLQPPNIDPELANSSSSILPLRSYWYVIAPTQTIYYNGDKFPELKDKFLVGTFGGGGNIHPLKFDKDNNHIIEDDVIRFNHYPYTAIIALAQSPDGDIYFGASDIYKLQLVNSEYKRQILFPIEVNSTNTVDIKDLQINQNEQKRTTEIMLQIHNNSKFVSHSPVLTMKVPKILLDRIYNVTNMENNKKIVDSTIDTKIPSYNIVNFKLTSGKYSHLAIVGTNATQEVERQHRQINSEDATTASQWPIPGILPQQP